MTNPQSRVPVTILTGFLGSGKTTLLNRILQENQGRRIGVLVNDFGDVNIDARLVQSVDGEAIDLSNGCICCSMRGGLVENVSRILNRPSAPDYLVVEASGISDPVGVAGAFRTSLLRDRVYLDSIVTLADAEQVRDPRLDRQLIEVQLRAADFVVLNKIDLIDERARRDVRTWVDALAPNGRVFETSQARVPLDLLLGVRADGPTDIPLGVGGNDVALAHARFDSWTYRSETPLAMHRLSEVLHRLPSSIFRGKGIARLADAPNLCFVVQVVGRRVAIDVIGEWADERPRTEIVFIGPEGGVSGEVLALLLNSARTCSTPLLPAANFQRLRRRVEGTREPGRATEMIPSSPTR